MCLERGWVGLTRATGGVVGVVNIGMGEIFEKLVENHGNCLFIRIFTRRGN
jgi:hypothetical protein